MNMTSRVLLFGTCALTSLACGAADRLNIRTGWWEVTSVMQSQGVPLSKAMMDKLTPEQRAQILAAAKESANKPERDTSKTCITEEDLREPFRSADTENCTQSIVRTTSTMQEVHMTCSGERPGSGTLRINTPTATTMNGTMDLRAGEGSDAFIIKATLSGRWLAADCEDEDDAVDADEDDGPADDTEEEE